MKSKCSLLATKVGWRIKDAAGRILTITEIDDCGYRWCDRMGKNRYLQKFTVAGDPLLNAAANEYAVKVLPPIATQAKHTDDMHIIGAWQDIEDAPQDGSIIIGATYDRRHIGAICMKFCDGDMEGAWVTERSHSPIRWNPECWTAVPPNAKTSGPMPKENPSEQRKRNGIGSGASTCWAVG